MLNALRLPGWNATPDPNIVLGSISVKQGSWAIFEFFLLILLTRHVLDEPPKQDRGDLLYQDLMDGESECPVCTEEIEAESPMWSCKSCHHIYHFACIRRWAANKYASAWSCPTCKSQQTTFSFIMIPSCWCGRKYHKDISYRGNTCGSTCHKTNTCESSKSPCISYCSKVCHPGPCEAVVCGVDCDTQPVNPYGERPSTLR